ncbi:MAG: hypothetical protein QW212_00830 [Nitrososphaerales archaeon]
MQLGDKDSRGNILLCGGLAADVWLKPDGTYFLKMEDNGEEIPAPTYEDALSMYNELNGTKIASFPTLEWIYKVRRRLALQSVETRLPAGAQIIAEYPGVTDPVPHLVYRTGNTIRCTCKGFLYRGTCRHVQGVSDAVQNNR